MARPNIKLVSPRTPDMDHQILPYTGIPTMLLWEDVKLCFRLCLNLPGTVLPIVPCRSGALDELYFGSAANVFDLSLHSILIITQILFLVSVPILLFSPLPIVGVLAFFVLFLVCNNAICWILNRDITDPVTKNIKPLESQTGISGPADEHWMFLNGVSVGKHWLQSNIDQLSLTFGRKVTGIHNPTSGILFDVIQCLIQRCFTYATQDVRDAYAHIKDVLLNHPEITKVVFIIHSQGGIEGGMVIDWLLQEIPQDALAQLEVYTFGNAASHFNNPLKYSGPNGETRFVPGEQHSGSSKVIPHIEHYANRSDFVAQWGVLNFAHHRGRYLGRIFVRMGGGHMLNQHYLDNMFPRDSKNRVRDHNEWADAEVDMTAAGLRDPTKNTVGVRFGDWAMVEPNCADAQFVDVNSPNTPILPRNWPIDKKPKVSDLSRLWKYRNGGSPMD